MQPSSFDIAFASHIHVHNINIVKVNVSILCNPLLFILPLLLTFTPSWASSLTQSNPDNLKLPPPSEYSPLRVRGNLG